MDPSLSKQARAPRKRAEPAGPPVSKKRKATHEELSGPSSVATGAQPYQQQAFANAYLDPSMGYGVGPSVTIGNPAAAMQNPQFMGQDYWHMFNNNYGHPDQLVNDDESLESTSQAPMASPYLQQQIPPQYHPQAYLNMGQHNYFMYGGQPMEYGPVSGTPQHADMVTPIQDPRASQETMFAQGPPPAGSEQLYMQSQAVQNATASQNTGTPRAAAVTLSHTPRLNSTPLQPQGSFAASSPGTYVNSSPRVSKQSKLVAPTPVKHTTSLAGSLVTPSPASRSHLSPAPTNAPTPRTCTNTPSVSPTPLPAPPEIPHPSTPAAAPPKAPTPFRSSASSDLSSVPPESPVQVKVEQRESATDIQRQVREVAKQQQMRLQQQQAAQKFAAQHAAAQQAFQQAQINAQYQAAMARQAQENPAVARQMYMEGQAPNPNATKPAQAAQATPQYVPAEMYQQLAHQANATVMRLNQFKNLLLKLIPEEQPKSEEELLVMIAKRINAAKDHEKAGKGTDGELRVQLSRAAAREVELNTDIARLQRQVAELQKQLAATNDEASVLREVATKSEDKIMFHQQQAVNASRLAEQLSAQRNAIQLENANIVHKAKAVDKQNHQFRHQLKDAHYRIAQLAELRGVSLPDVHPPPGYMQGFSPPQSSPPGSHSPFPPTPRYTPTMSLPMESQNSQNSQTSVYSSNPDEYSPENAYALREFELYSQRAAVPLNHLSSPNNNNNPINTTLADGLTSGPSYQLHLTPRLVGHSRNSSINENNDSAPSPVWKNWIAFDIETPTPITT